jgi:hypothetical protein
MRLTQRQHCRCADLSVEGVELPSAIAAVCVCGILAEVGQHGAGLSDAAEQIALRISPSELTNRSLPCISRHALIPRSFMLTPSHDTRNIPNQPEAAAWRWARSLNGRAHAQ